MKVLIPEQIKEIDRRCEEEYGIPKSRLMENAGRAVYIETLKFLRECGRDCENLKIVFLCGKGNNGGDGLVCARYFINHGADVHVFICEADSINDRDVTANYNTLKNTGADIIFLSEANFSLLEEQMSDADAVVDAMFGIGLNSPVRGVYKRIIEEINHNTNMVVAVDIPTGVDGFSGRILGEAVNADLTVVLAALKSGNLMYPGRDFCGELKTVDIGVPAELADTMKIKIFQTESSLAKEFFKRRNPDSHKGIHGKIGIISGSEGMTGAGIMASRASLKTGAGLVYNIVPGGLANIYEAGVIEAVTFGQGDETYFSSEYAEDVLEICQKLDTIVMGPGMGTYEETEEFIADILEGLNTLENAESKTLILDADALNMLSNNIDILKNININVILTPHPSEMARLCNVSIAEVQADRINAARFLSSQCEQTVVLKGASTITAFPDGSVYINPTGNSGMATAGSGDVLCGIIAAMAAFGNSELAAPCGVYLHGLAGDFACEKFGEYSMTACDIIENIYCAIRSL